MTQTVYFFGDGESEGDPDRRDVLGGKGASLAELTRAGLPVPPGFTISVECCESYLDAGGAWPGGLRDDIRDVMDRLELACGRKFGAGDDPLLVSVRSGAAVSMPGMMDTILNCGRPDAGDPFETLLECVESVFNSWNSPRAIAYRQDRNIHGLSGTAVTVQAMFPSRVSGVAFTANPNNPDAGEIVIEASYGLGEALVSGEVDPDNFVLSRDDLTVKRTYIGRKDRIIPAAGDTSAPDSDAASLTDDQINEIARIALGVEELFGFPVDVEWGLADGRFALLQARRIRPSQAQSQQLLLQSLRTALHAEIRDGRGPWVIHNLSETLGHPTWLTWSVQERFMSGGGGFGAMYRLAGFAPSESVRTRGPVRLIAGKIYMDTSVASELFFENYPFKYDMNLLRWDPDAAQSPPTVPCGTFRSRAAAARKAARVDWRLREMARTLDSELNNRVIPEFVQWCRDEKQRTLGEMTGEELAVLWRSREHRVMDEFAPQSLLPSLVTGMALAELRAFIAENFWDADEDADELAGMLSAAPTPDKTLQANAGLFAIVGGEVTVDQWLEQYGHRGPDELDLMSRRWRESPEEVAAMAARLKGGQDPMELHHTHVEQIALRTSQLRRRLKGRRLERFDDLIGLLRRYIPFREDGKYYLMLGYDLLRDVALEAGRRL
ncbi:MAG: PEP/pyruvate-binding domain-containing protein, partial [Phycisphaerae bacterium]|nr:PEP/pyruvate-binding domain-containing protein [Phycisphaerae bacterium]